MTISLRLVLSAVMIAALQAQAAGRQPVRSVMQQKLGRSQAILGAVVTGNFDTLGRESRAMLALMKDPAWAALVTPETRHRTDAFALTVQDLVAAADRRDLDDAAMAQVAMNLHCVRCHQLMARIAKAPAKAN